jgi:pyruvate,water dikinase
LDSVGSKIVVANSVRAALVALAMTSCAPAADAVDPCGPGASPDDRDGACWCDPGFFGDPDVACTPHADLCAQADERVGHSACAHTIDDDAQWDRLSLGGGPPSSGVRRMGKYLVPASPEARLPTVFADANYYRLHYCLMSVAFEPAFPNLSVADYAELILTHASREFYGGSTFEFEDERPTRYGFSIETANRPDAAPDLESVYTVYRHLSDRFGPGELAYVPKGELQEAAAAKWSAPPFPIATKGDAAVSYETYTPGIAYGRVRLAGDDSTATSYGWQDLVVFDEVPLTFEGVIAAAVTGTRQDLLSHLNVLSGQRGTPNVFVQDAIALFTPFEGKLVRLEADAGSYTLTAATEAEAQAWWDEHRPNAGALGPADLDHVAFDAFRDIPTATAEERAAARSRFGAKTVGLATLAPLIPTHHQTPGFGIPFHDYAAFMADNTWEVDLGAGPTTASYAETIAAWLDDPTFRTDASLRAERLAALRDEMTSRGVVDPELVAALRDRIVEVFGDDAVMVRIRSSSNAEDTAAFNGAGLYDSASACAADSFAPAGAAASLCDPDKEPRTLEAALAEVWASLWNYGAFEERDYYQIDHGQVAMGATVSLRYEDELANGVAFTGNPRDPKNKSYLINAQAGDTDVVSPTPGVTAELSYLTITDGEVTGIDRVVASSLVEPGEVVVSDTDLALLGGLMAELAITYPIDDAGTGGAAPLLDLEFKIAPDGGLVIKQIRTFVPSAYASDPNCRDVP